MRSMTQVSVLAQRHARLREAARAVVAAEDAVDAAVAAGGTDEGDEAVLVALKLAVETLREVLEEEGRDE